MGLLLRSQLRCLTSSFIGKARVLDRRKAATLKCERERRGVGFRWNRLVLERFRLESMTPVFVSFCFSLRDEDLGWGLLLRSIGGCYGKMGCNRTSRCQSFSLFQVLESW